MKQYIPTDRMWHISHDNIFQKNKIGSPAYKNTSELTQYQVLQPRGKSQENLEQTNKLSTKRRNSFCIKDWFKDNCILYIDGSGCSRSCEYNNKFPWEKKKFCWKLILNLKIEIVNPRLFHTINLKWCYQFKSL